MPEIKYIDTENDRLYVNLDFKNDTNNIVDSKFNFTPSGNILDKDVNKYQISVIRFNVDSLLFPVMIYEDSPDLDITMISDNNDFSVKLNYQSFSDLPTNDERYYYIYSINHFLDIVNKGLKDCFDGLENLDNTILSTEPPKFIYEDNKINYICEKNYSIDTTGNIVKFFFSKKLAQFFQFHKTFINYTSLGDLLYMQFLPEFNFINEVDTNLIHMIAEHNNANFLSPFKKLIITSSMTMKNELKLDNNRSENVIENENIITDFTSDYQNPHELREGIFYFNNDETRFIVLNSSSSIRNFDISFKYVDKQNITRPLLLQADESFNIKLLFKKV